MRKRLFATFVLLAGLLTLGAGGYHLWDGADLALHGVETSGQVVAVSQTSHWDSETRRQRYLYTPTFQFYTQDQRSIVFSAAASSDANAWYQGQFVPIIYDSTRPHRATIGRFGSLYGRGTAFGVLGGVLMVVGSLRWRKAAPRSEPDVSAAGLATMRNGGSDEPKLWLRLLPMAGLLSCAAGGYWLFVLLRAGVRLLPVENTVRYQGAALLLVIGALVALLAVRARRQAETQTTLRRAHPQQPWLWRADWARHQSRENASMHVSGLIFMLVWNLLVLPPALGAYPKYSGDPLFVIVFAIVFPAAGLGTLLWQSYALVRRALAKTLPLRLQAVPGRLGQGMRCELSVANVRRSLRWECELVCLYEHRETRDTGDGHESRFVRDELWRQVVAPQVQHRPGRSRLSMAFDVDAAQPPTGPHLGGEINWVVIVRGLNRRMRVAYWREYSVPVFEARSATTHQKVAAPAVPPPDTIRPAMAGAKRAPRTSGGPANHAQRLQQALATVEKEGIEFSEQGVRYGTLVWKRSPGHQMLIWGGLGSLILLLGFSATFVSEVIIDHDWWGAPLGLGVLISLGFLGLSMFFGLHRYRIAFDTAGISRHSALLGYTWCQTVPWDYALAAGVDNRGDSESAQRRITYYGVVINPDQHQRRLVISPGFRDRSTADSLAFLIDGVINKRQIGAGHHE